MATVLVVEDDPAVAHMLELALTLEGHDVETVGDGDSAAARLDGPPAEVVVLDVMLPGQDGLAVLRQLRDRRDWSASKVVVVSARREDDEVWRGWAAGADYYLTKPFDLDHLRDIVDRLIAGLPLS